MKEDAAIRSLMARLPRAAAQRNALFESDAELVRLGDALYGFTVDEYSPEEDFFSSFDPETLGFNLVAGTVSDLLASGVQPAFYMHSMTLPRGAAEAFEEGLFAGLRAGLQAAGAALLGGDTSFAETWRYVGVAFGPAQRPLMRSGAVPGARLYATGPLGCGNRQALLLHLVQDGVDIGPERRQAASPRFPCRLAEARAAWPHARFAIDSSDGLVGSLAALARANPDVAFVFRPEAALVDTLTAAVAREMGLPPELMLFGGAGEYELVFGVDRERAAAFESDLRAAGSPPLLVGEVTEGHGLQVETARGRSPLSLEALPDPRGLAPAAYIERMLALVREVLA